MSPRPFRHPRFLVLFLSLFLSAVLGVPSSPAATLEQLSNERLIDESTEIVRGTVVYCNQIYRQPVIWTVCEINVRERFKGAAAAKVQVAIPGGTAAGLRQSFEGTPTLARNAEYLFFLWQGKSGLKQIMGLSQGLLNIATDAKGNLILTRAKTDDRMVDAAGNSIGDTGVNVRLSDFKAKILSRAANKASGARQ